MAARWTEVTFINKTQLNLRKVSDELAAGVWDNDRPPIQIGDRAIWASESDGFLTGTEGRVTYDLETVVSDGATPVNVGQVRLHWNNPFSGSNSYHHSVTPQATASSTFGTFSVVHMGGHGADARVTFQLFDGFVVFDEETGELVGSHPGQLTVAATDRYAAIWEQRGGPPFQARHGLTAGQYQQAFDELVAQGFRLVHVSGYAVGDQDRYAAIWEQRQGPAWQARHGLTAQQYQQSFDQMMAEGFRLVLVSGYSIRGQDHYAAIWEQRGGPPFQARHGITAAHYQQSFDQLVAEGFTLTCVSGYAVR
jgi:hypothetical protein